MNAITVCAAREHLTGAGGLRDYFLHGVKIVCENTLKWNG
jgi:hypothetical protein